MRHGVNKSVTPIFLEGTEVFVQTQRQVFKLFTRKAAFVAALFGLLFFVGAPRAQARQNEDQCRRTIQNDEAKLHQAVHDHGWGSKQAETWRHRLVQHRQSCFKDIGRWWDGDANSWHSDRDWDRDWDRYRDHDHDRDRDRNRDADHDDHDHH